MALVLLGAAVWRRRWPLGPLAVLVWLGSYEVMLGLISGHGLIKVLTWEQKIALVLMILLLNGLAWRVGLVPDDRWLLVTALLWAVWIAIGLPVNQHTMAGFNPAAEALNEGTKTAWGLAYLWPLLGFSGTWIHAGRGTRRARVRS